MSIRQKKDGRHTAGHSFLRETPIPLTLGSEQELLDGLLQGQGAQQERAQPPHETELGGLRRQSLDDHNGLSTPPYGLGTSGQDHQLSRRLVEQQEGSQSAVTPGQGEILQLQPTHLLATLAALPQVTACQGSTRQVQLLYGAFSRQSSVSKAWINAL